MKLSVYERLLLKNIVPQMSGMNFAFIKQARELIENMFTEEEETQLSMKESAPGQVTWRTLDDTGKPIPQEREIEVPEGLKNKIGTFLKMLSMQEKLQMNQMSLLNKFVPDWDKETK